MKDSSKLNTLQILSRPALVDEDLVAIESQKSCIPSLLRLFSWSKVIEMDDF
jgi:hypothetical protein